MDVIARLREVHGIKAADIAKVRAGTNKKNAKYPYPSSAEDWPASQVQHGILLGRAACAGEGRIERVSG
jgi:hypothetical protein